MLEGSNQIIESLIEVIHKQERIIKIYEKWIELKINEGTILEFILKNEFKKIAIYGIGSLGRSLCRELELLRQSVEIAYIVDKNPEVEYENYMFYTMQDELPEVDVMIITPIAFYEEIVLELAQKVNCPLLSLEDIIV